MNCLARGVGAKLIGDGARGEDCCEMFSGKARRVGWVAAIPASKRALKRLKDSWQGPGGAENLPEPAGKQALRVLKGPEFGLGKPGNLVVIC